VYAASAPPPGLPRAIPSGTIRELSNIVQIVLCLLIHGSVTHQCPTAPPPLSPPLLSLQTTTHPTYREAMGSSTTPDGVAPSTAVEDMARVVVGGR